MGHSVYRIEGQDIETPLFLRQNGLSLSAARLSAKMVRCGKFLEKYHGPVSPYGVFSDSPNLTALFRVTCPLRLKYKTVTNEQDYDSMRTYSSDFCEDKLKMSAKPIERGFNGE